MAEERKGTSLNCTLLRFACLAFPIRYFLRGVVPCLRQTAWGKSYEDVSLNGVRGGEVEEEVIIGEDRAAGEGGDVGLFLSGERLTFWPSNWAEMTYW